MSFGNAPPLATRRVLEFGRVAVDVANTAFWEGLEYRVSYEFSIASTPLVLRFTAVQDFIIQLQSLSIDAGNLAFRAYRDVQGTEGGTYGDVVPIYSQNIMTFTPSVPPSSVIETGGSFTPNAGETAVETLRLRTSGATAQRSTVTGAIGDERGLAPGTYYLTLSRIDGSDTATGVFDLKWEERAP